MRTFIIKICLFTVPFFLFFVVSLVINPYNHPELPIIESLTSNKKDSRIYRDERLQVAINASNHYKTAFFGDSRTLQLFDYNRNSISGVENLSFGGARFNEIMTTVWHSLEQNPELEKIYVGLSFDHYNKNNVLPLMTMAIEESKSPILTTLSKHQTKSVLSLLKILFYDDRKIDDFMVETLDTNLWNYQLQSTARSYYENMQKNDVYFTTIDSLVSFCNSKSIEVVLFTPPTHQDHHSQIKRWGQADNWSDFRFKMNDLNCNYIDFETDSLLTTENDNFKDPFHLKNGQNQILNKLLNH